MYLSFYAFLDSQDSFQTFMPGSSHIQSVLIGVKYQKLSSNFGVYLLFAILRGQIQSKLLKLQTCNLQTGQLISYKYVNQFRLNLPHPNNKK